ncbi:ZINC FINGER C-X8-C-X5-C-X3-H TYPE FAMILY PROTEIN [Salix purpurea]|uniref:ZINC FINGER C-X8-C-X5-C-X3-H TYPE FAMILY PROTEIN n=1 Tax=Salix purpurea TaxID=77065 RepID=A0A9Q0T9T8_SALPP|nr:ZINC FINGER C-X8-C-X5-C-X3-H TYPE FAMILY PROTEIN [Salix purpurea]
MSDSAPACKYFTFSTQMVHSCSHCSTQSKGFETVSNIGNLLRKKPRICENNARPSSKMLVGKSNAMMTGGYSSKTQLCMKFRTGQCSHGSKCLSAHAVCDLRKALPKLRRVLANEDKNPCRMFNSGNGCTYGNKCRFLHVGPENFKKHLGQYCESSAISIGTTGTASSGVHKKGFKKTRLCNNWELTGGCPYGKVCHFAHGQQELEKSDGNIALASGIVPTEASKSLLMGKDDIGSNHKHEAQAKHCMFKWKAIKKIRGIYADWIEDMHLLHSSLDRVEN